jgi:D-alanyl-lipoteichoic acid acyltransferase DltB (MBOAT superfamily)
MLFNSIAFLIFFPLVTAAYFLLPHRARWAMLLAASCYFYMKFVPVYILILALTIVIDYFAGILIENAQGRQRMLRLLMSLVSNIGVLFFFKYYNFAAENLAALAQVLHWNYSVPALGIILPIGLSFHTFQAMSYTIEVYRGRQQAERYFGIFSLYVMFYPQLVAGPIERPQNLLPQFREEHHFDYQRVTDGLKRMAWGMFKKVVIADNLALVVNSVYDDPTRHHGLSFVIATFFFAQQIYCDFSGYADIALGAAQVMGFRLMENFRRPYFARSISDFWSRWHISLSSWFRDYVYIPLGGNRVSVPRWYANLMIVFLISGVWHGARWTYVAWGALHGFYLLFGLATASLRARMTRTLRLQEIPLLHRAWQMLVTTSLVCIAWVFFRAASMGDAVYILKEGGRGIVEAARLLVHKAPAADWLGLSGGAVLFGLTLILLLELAHWQQRHGSIRARVASWPIWLRWPAYQCVIVGIYMFGRFEAQQFIYFQF